jgi:adenylosuccinate lyase
MNARNCERLCGLHAVLGGHVAMLERISGDQWNEGDVSCSVVRRVALPDMFFAMDGILETLLTILLEMKIFREVVEADTQNTLPFLLSTTLLMEAVRKGAGREEAHALIKQHSHAVLEDLRSGRTRENDLFARLAADERFPLDPAAVEAIRNHPDRFLGEAAFQVDAFAQEVDTLLNRFPECRDIHPGSLL